MVVCSAHAVWHESLCSLVSANPSAKKGYKIALPLRKYIIKILPEKIKGLYAMESQA
jgi:hypothetical protein